MRHLLWHHLVRDLQIVHPKFTFLKKSPTEEPVEELEAEASVKQQASLTPPRRGIQKRVYTATGLRYLEEREEATKLIRK